MGPQERLLRYVFSFAGILNEMADIPRYASAVLLDFVDRG